MSTSLGSTDTSSKPDIATSDASVDNGKGKGKALKKDEDHMDEDEDDEDEDDEEEEADGDEDEEDEAEEEAFEEIDPSAILPTGRRTRGVKVDYTSAEALAKAGFKPGEADDESDDEMKG